MIFRTGEEKRWPFVQGNATHMPVYYEQLRRDFRIEIVVNRRAVRQLKEKVAEQLEYKTVLYDFIKRGVIIAACRNAMKGQRMEEQRLLNSVTTVASDAVELVVKQQAEYSYTKP